MKALTLSSIVVASLCIAGSAMADSFTVNIVRTDAGGNLAVGQSFDYEIRGVLTNTDPNFGLAFFAYNLEVTGPSAITLGDAIVQSGGPETSTFEKPLGYSVVFSGEAIGDILSQAGGGQNTIDNSFAASGLDFPSGEPVGNIGHGAGVVLHQGTFTIPEGTASGEYTLQIMAGSLVANMLEAAPAEGPDPVVAVATVIDAALLTFEVGIATIPMLVHQSEEGEPQSSPCSGYIDPRFDSSNGTDVDLCFTSKIGSDFIPDEIVMVFSEQVRNAGGGALTAEAFTVEVTGGAAAPGVASVNAVMNGEFHVVTIRLDGPIPVQEWTTIIAGVENLAGSPIVNNGNQGIGVFETDRIDITCLPGDVNQSGNTSPFDLIRAKQRQLGTCGGSCPECSGALLGYDIDRKGNVSTIDLVFLKQLFLNSGNSTREWNGAILNNDQP